MKKKLNGTIVKIIDDATARVVVLRYKKHPKYFKRFRVTKNYLVQTMPDKKLEIGQQVSIEESKPISKTKHWRIA